MELLFFWYFFEHFALCFYFMLKATANVSAIAGQASSSVKVKADGKDRVKLDALMFRLLQRGSNSVGLTVNVSQNLLPSASDLHLSMAANTSSEKCIYFNFSWQVIMNPYIFI